MTLREEFENEVRKTKTLATVLFETSNKYYIEWLEAKVKALRLDTVISSELCSHNYIPYNSWIEECKKCGDTRNRKF